MSTQYFHHIHLPHPFCMPYYLPLVSTLRQELFYLSVLRFRKQTFLFV
jgi:hypothetical protein